jgi:threonine/homoserine/homoserine lactone efflux protein
MSPTLLVGLAVFTFVASITPGPNNLMLMASGANFGLRRTVPHMTGVALGFSLMVLGVGLGLAGLVARAPWIFDVIRWGGAAYLVWLAWKIATAKGIGSEGAGGKGGPARPMTFLQAAAFQWVNPKAWAMALGAVTTYASRAHLVLDVTMIALVFALTSAPCVGVWTGFGVGMKQVLSRPGPLRAFNLGMAALLLLSLYPLFLETR